MAREITKHIIHKGVKLFVTDRESDDYMVELDTKGNVVCVNRSAPGEVTVTPNRVFAEDSPEKLKAYIKSRKLKLSEDQQKEYDEMTKKFNEEKLTIEAEALTWAEANNVQVNDQNNRPEDL